MPDITNLDRRGKPLRMPEPYRDQMIAAMAAVTASLAIHAVLVFAGHLLFNAYIAPLAEKSGGILFAARVEPSPEAIEAYEPQKMVGGERPVEAGIDTSDILRLEPSLLDKPVSLPGSTQDLAALEPDQPFGAGASKRLFARPEELRPAKGPEPFGGTDGDGSAESLFGGGLQEQFKNRDILLVWLVDSSPSILDQMDAFKGEIKPFFDRLNGISPGRLKMTVVSYAEEAELLLDRPTDNPATVRALLDAIKEKSYKNLRGKALARHADPGAKISPTGENTMRVLRETATIKSGEGRQVIIALLTDERGDDAGEWQYALRDLRAKNIPLFVFGPTARMISPTRPELLVIQDKAFVSPSNPEGYALAQGTGEIGSAEEGREPYCRNWGAAMFGVNIEQPAVAGPFELSALAKLTGGKYFFIDDGPAAGVAAAPPDARSAINAVNDDRRRNSAARFGLSVMAEYAPEYSGEARNRFMNSFGKRFIGIVEDFEKAAKPPARFTESSQITDAARAARSNIGAINRAISQVSSLKAGPDVPRRWLAHRDLFLAQLYAARYKLTEYIEALGENAEKEFTAAPDTGGFVHWMELQNFPVAGSTDLPVTEADGILTLSPVRAVITSDGELDEFLRKNAALGENQERPEVNFAQEALIVVSLGQVYSPEAEVEILNVTLCRDALEVVVRETNPRVASPNLDRPCFPNHVVVVPRTGLNAKFVTLDEWTKARIAEDAPLLKGGKASASYRQDARLAISRVLRRHGGTPWAEVAGQMAALGTFALREQKARPATAGAATPTAPGDF